MVIHQPLDLQYWFVTILSGTPDIFLFIGILAITSMSAYFKMSMITYGMFLVMFGVILTALGTNTILILLILVFAPLLFWWIRRLVE